MSYYGTEREIIENLEKELAAALAEIAARRKDAERLDWLDTVDCGINHMGYGEYRDYIGRGFIKKIREVIDAAMKECAWVPTPAGQTDVRQTINEYRENTEKNCA